MWGELMQAFGVQGVQLHKVVDHSTETASAKEVEGLPTSARLTHPSSGIRPRRNCIRRRATFGLRRVQRTRAASADASPRSAAIVAHS